MMLFLLSPRSDKFFTWTTDTIRWLLMEIEVGVDLGGVIDKGVMNTVSQIEPFFLGV
jgi:hypothetical protein